MEYLGLAWISIIAFTFFLYIVLDGFTLGIGMTFPFLTPHEKDIAISSILPTWDGNQTWLVFSLAALYGMFPIAFAFLLPKIYLPAILLAMMLLFRGICFEFRLKATKGIKNWDRLFCISSYVITFIHGYLAGQLIIGYKLVHYESGLGFKLITGLTLIIGYMLLGSTRLILKTESTLFIKAQKISAFLLRILPSGMLIIGILTFFYHDLPMWYTSKFFILAILAACLILLFIILDKAIKSPRNFIAYWVTIGIFAASYFSMLVYIFPYIIPYELTYDQAKAGNMTLGFTFIIAIIMIPILLLYTSYAYYIFRGTTKKKLEY